MEIEGGRGRHSHREYSVTVARQRDKREHSTNVTRTHYMLV